MGVFKKMNIFRSMKIFWILFWGHCKIKLYYGVISMHLNVFFKVKVQNGEYFLFGVLEIPDIFGGEW